MKISIITLHAVPNYGSLLQTFATQEKLKQYADNVEVINYKRKNTYGFGLIKHWCGHNLIKMLAFLPSLIGWRRVFSPFRKEQLQLTKRTYTSEQNFDAFIDDADFYCTGSDQVWNTGWNGGIIPQLYLSFISSSKRKFAYASSFGKDQLDDFEISQSKKYIMQYEKISVREDSGVKILKEQYGYQNAIQIVDPTLAMPPEFWRKYAPAKILEGNYILIYNLNRSKAFDAYAKEFSRRTGLQLVRLCTRYDQILRCGKSVLIPNVFDFISLIDNARYLITDSFHGTAFSMNLNTEPICIYPEKYSSRLSSFLRLVGQEHRHIENFHDFNVMNRPVDWEHVHKVLERERERVDEFLRSIFADCNEPEGSPAVDVQRISVNNR
jgi:hypothetical protein